MQREQKRNSASAYHIAIQMSSDNNNAAAQIKNAASLLVKGGTLTGEPCEKCGGVVIRFGNKTSCINCGAETTGATQVAAATESADKKKEVPDQQLGAAGSDLRSCAEIIEKKIVRLASQMAEEEDVLVQKQKADLLEGYLRILEKVRSMAKAA